jgi:hypothetical protein
MIDKRKIYEEIQALRQKQEEADIDESLVNVGAIAALSAVLAGEFDE